MKKLKILFIVSLFFAFSNSNFAQIGISAGYTSVNSNFEFEQNLTSFAPSYFVGLDYWFRLKNHRIEFYPGVQFLQSAQETFDNKLGETETLNHSLSLASAKLNIRIYPFDFDGDCNCPTWSKDGDFFEKGLFVFSTAGIGQLSKKREAPISGNLTENEMLVTYGGGIGLDIGLSDFVTISPFVMYERSTKSTWDLHPCDFCDKVADETNLSPFSFGIHMEFRWKK